MANRPAKKGVSAHDAQVSAVTRRLVEAESMLQPLISSPGDDVSHSAAAASGSLRAVQALLRECMDLLQTEDELGISEEKSRKLIEVEEALRESEEFNRRIIESSFDCIKALDLDGNLLSMSSGGQRLLEIADITPYLNTCWIDWWQECDRPMVAEAVAAARGGGMGRFQAFCPSVTGKPRWWDVVITPMCDSTGRPERLLSVSRDVTARQQAEAEAEEGKRILDTLMEFVPEGITIADAPDVKIRIVSRYGQETLGASRHGMTAEAIADRWKVYHPDGATPMATEDWPLVRAILKGETVRDAEIMQMNARGECLSLLCNAAPVRSTSGDIVGGIVAWRDITERKRAEEMLRRQARNLAESEERQRLARELHDSVSQAIYGIVLGARTARAHLGRDPEQIAASLDYVLSLAEMGLSDMRALIFDLRPETLQSEGLVRALAKRAAFIQNRQGIQVALDLCDEPDVALNVKESLYSIAREALHNMVKHARATQVSIRLAQSAESLALEVYDNGVGFDPHGEFPEHLGLQSMRERAIYLGGTLEIDSRPGYGTRILVHVPLSSENAAATADGGRPAP